MKCRPLVYRCSKRLATHVATGASALLLAACARGPEAPGKLAFVVEAWRTSVYQTEYMEECPDGIAIGNDEIWFDGLSPADKDKWTTGGTQQVLDLPRRPQSYLRGPQQEDVCWNPTAVVDPPMRVVRGRYSYGMNLDGTTDGSPTPKSCAHGKFTDPAGKVAVDNQLYRLMGCVYGYRDKGYLEHHANRERQDESQGIILIDVDGVEDARNDPAVQVRFFLSATPLHFDTVGHIVPFSTYETVRDRFGYTVKGRIVEGVLETEPADVTLPVYGNDAAADMVFRDFRIRMEIAQDGTRAKGLWAGYQTVESFWDYIQKVQHNVPVGQYSCPAMYVAAHELADGYPDPKTGECTALSSAFDFEAVAAFIKRPSASPSDEERLAKQLMTAGR